MKTAGLAAGMAAFSFVQITDHHLRADEATRTCGADTAGRLRATLRHVATHHAGRVD